MGEWDEDDELDVATPAGTVWSEAPRAALHWTDAPVVLFSTVENLFSVVAATAGQIKSLFQAHANHVGVRAEVRREMEADLERIVGEQ